MQRSELIDRLKATIAKPGKELADGTVLIGHVPVVAPQAYLHLVFAPLVGDELAELERKLGYPLPAAYADFLCATANGLGLFGGVLELFGHRRNSARTSVASAQPFSIVTTNTVERPSGLEEGATIVGFYREDGSVIVMHQGTGVVRWKSRDASSSLLGWESLDSFLQAETARLEALLGPEYEGASVHSDVNTLPLVSASKPEKPKWFWRR